MGNFRLPAETHIGYAHLRVADLARALAFYCDLAGFREIARDGETALLSASGTPPAQIILAGQPGAQPKPPHTTGLYHVAIRLPDRASLARLVRRLLEAGWPFQGAADHGVSEALYLPDPDGNGLELYVDRPREEWRWANGQIAMTTDPLDVPDLLGQAGDVAWNGIDPGADVGHMHIQVSDLGRAEAFYGDLLGLEVMQRSYPGALFVAAGGYHHHLGLNTWAGRNAAPPPPDAAGLIAFALAIPGAAAWQAVIERVREAGLPLEDRRVGEAEGLLTRDPDGIGVALVKGS